MDKSAAIYARVATEEQAKGGSIESQVEQLRGYLTNKGYKKIEVFADDGYSGRYLDRPSFNRLISNLNQFEAIAVSKIDRISRNNRDILGLINNHLKPFNKRLLISTCDIDSSTQNGYMFLSLLDSFSKYERKVMIESITNGMKRSASMGKWSGRAMLGYDIINGRLSINNRESMVIREIFELRSRLETYKSIAEHMNRKGYKTKRGNSFGTKSIRTILKNPIYAGLVKNNKSLEDLSNEESINTQFIKGMHSPIIDPELWNRVQTLAGGERDSVSV